METVNLSAAPEQELRQRLYNYVLFETQLYIGPGLAWLMASKQENEGEDKKNIFVIKWKGWFP